MRNTTIVLIGVILAVQCGATTIDVNWDGSGDYLTIQEAINAADCNDVIVIVVAEGTYVENIDFDGKNFTLTSADPNDADVVADTVINGGGSGSAATFAGTESANCVLSGFTITNGDTNGDGRCISGNYTGATIKNCIIRDNGGGVHGCDGLITGCTITLNDDRGVKDCDGVITNCVISHNRGGLLSCDGVVSNCTITENSDSLYDGGGLCWCDAEITNCIIANNFGEQYGGGLFDCDGAITNCIIANNIVDQAWAGGGGLALCDGPITNCTITGNIARDNYEYMENGGGGLYGCDGTVTNCIIQGNSSPELLGNSATISYSCVSGASGKGNIGADPLLVDADNGDYHLKSTAGRWDVDSWVFDGVTSPCIDAGNPGCHLGDETNEPNNVRINMGAYGGRAEASKSPANWASLADLTNDRKVNFNDFAVFAQYWLDNGACIPSDLSRNESADVTDLIIFADKWLWER